MKRICLFIVLLVVWVSIPSPAQEPRTSTLEVTGTASMQVTPDQTNVRLQVAVLRMHYNEALETLDIKMKALAGTLQKAGFGLEDIKTQDFNIRRNTGYRRGVRIDSGFIATQYVVLEFPYDKKRLGEVIDAVGSSPADADMQIAFGLSDHKARQVRAEVLRAAIGDAKQQAGIIAKEAEVELLNMIQIRYGEAGVPPPGPVYRTAARSEEVGPWDIEARDIDLRETIYITWSIR